MKSPHVQFQIPTIIENGLISLELSRTSVDVDGSTG